MFCVLKKMFGAGMLAAMFVVTPGIARTAQASTLSALPVTTTGGGTIVMSPGEVKTVAVSFQNTSSTAWRNDGAGYISIYTYGPKYRSSVFDPGNWLSPSQVKRLIEPSVKPGSVGNIKFDLHAPSTEGSYKETFKLASEDISWIDGGEFTLNINVAQPKNAAQTPSVNSADTAAHSAVLALQSANSVKTTAGKTILFTAGFKNTGTTTWKRYGLVAPDITIASSSTFSHNSWNDTTLASVDGQVKPGESAYVTFLFNAPPSNGTHAAKFQLTVDGQEVADAFVEIPVTVTGGSGEAVQAVENENAETVAESVSYIDEPIIRVGVLIVDHETDDEIVVSSEESDFEVRDTNGNLLAEMKKGESVEAAWDGSNYLYDRGIGTEKSTYALRFIPKIESAVMTVTNFDRRVTRNAGFADNTFRNILEIRYNESKDRVWLINELKMEMYLRGLAETSNISPMEFQKSLVTAARTYAFYHWTRGTKHAKEFFHVEAYADQVYKGYGQELRSPRVVQAVEATRGRYVTYNADIAITPYFSRSDGRTRTWSEVWYGEVPWAVSVPVPCDNGKSLLGHGVGMSAQGALCMANQGMMWDEILKYFFTGIELNKKWE